MVDEVLQVGLVHLHLKGPWTPYSLQELFPHFRANGKKLDIHIYDLKIIGKRYIINVCIFYVIDIVCKYYIYTYV